MDALAPSKARYKVIYFGIALAVIQYIDRVCIGQASGDIQKDLHLVKEQMGWIFGAFTVAYALFEIPTGWLGDRFGTRKTLLRVTLWWSFFTAATGLAWSRWSMIITRFLFGMGEAGCFPNLTRAFSTWLQPNEKVRAQAILWLAARWGGAITPLLVYQFLLVVHWRTAFMIFGAMGLVWGFFFYRWYRDEPRDHPDVNQAERALLANNPAVARHDPVPWSRYLRVRTTWLLWLQYFCFSYCWYFFPNWLPTFLKENYQKEFSPVVLALLAGVPLFGGGFGNLISGFLTARLTRWTGSLAKTRRILAFCGFTGAALLFLVPSRTHSLPLIMAAVGFASLMGDLSMPCSWGACMDVGGKFAGTFSGSMNMMGNLGGAVATAVVGHLLDSTQRNWNLVFIISAAIFVLGGVCWKFIDPVTPMDDRDPLPQAA